MEAIISVESCRNVLEALPHPILVIDASCRIALLNSEAAALLKTSPASVTGKLVWEALQPGQYFRMQECIEHALATGLRVSFRFYYSPAHRWFELSGRTDSHGRLILSISDASEVRSFEHELDSIESKICEAFRNATLGLAVADENGWFLEANEAFLSITGYSLEELRARDYVTITHSEDRRKHVEAGFNIQQDSSRAAVYEKRYIRKDRTVVWVRMNVSVLSRPGARTRRSIALCEDVTQARAAAERLRLSESRFRTLIEQSSDLISVFRPDGLILYESPAIEGMLGYTAAEMIGKNCFDFMHPEDLPQVLSEIAAKVPSEGLTGRIVFRYLHKNGSWRYLEGIGRSLLRDPAVQGIVANCRDITEQVETRRKLKEALQEAREATELKSRFLANMSHEIRTPMNGVVGLSELLLDTELTAEQREYVEGIQMSGDLLLRVINDILDFSKIEAGKLEIDLAPFDLRATVEGVADIFRALCSSKRLGFRLSISASTPAVVLGDGVRMRQVLTNLLSNAVKFTPAGSVELCTDAGVLADGRVSIRVSVRDTGIGISPEQQGRLFSSFTQGDSSTTRRFGGTGLGLAISRQLVELMGGSIGLESEPGQGTLLWFALPFELPLEPPRAMGRGETAECLLAPVRC